MRQEIDSATKLAAWLSNPGPAIFQGQDLLAADAAIAAKPLVGCSFLGCSLGPQLAAAAASASCLVFPKVPDLAFDAFTPGMYSPSELYDKFDPSNASGTYPLCLDWKIYNSYADPATKVARDCDVETLLLRRLHDSSIDDALDDLLVAIGREKCVAVMGGHDTRRDAPIYGTIAAVSQELTLAGYMIVTGGGPGLMEAANLGAYTAGFANPEQALQGALAHIKTAPTYKDVNWLARAFEAWRALGTPKDIGRARSIGIPTWFYGHEPPNVFATNIAKYFENSIREEGLLAVAAGGVIFAEGNAGTVQEIFQDACQNYYRTYKKKSPMILLDSSYWNPPSMNFNTATDKRKQAYALLHKLATFSGFDDYVLMTDDPKVILDFIKRHPPV